MDYRPMPHTTNGASPHTLMFGREKSQNCRRESKREERRKGKENTGKAVCGQEKESKR